MFDEWVKFSAAITKGRKRGLPRAVRFAYLELCIVARRRGGRIPLASMRDIDAVHDLLGGTRRELAALLRHCTVPLDPEDPNDLPMLVLEGPERQRVLIVTQFEKWNHRDRSAERTRNYRARLALKKQQLASPRDGHVTPPEKRRDPYPEIPPLPPTKLPPGRTKIVPPSPPPPPPSAPPPAAAELEELEAPTRPVDASPNIDRPPSAPASERHLIAKSATPREPSMAAPTRRPPGLFGNELAIFREAASKGVGRKLSSLRWSDHPDVQRGIEAHAPRNVTAPELETWLRESVETWARLHRAPGEAKFQSGYAPRAWVRWLDNDRADPAARTGPGTARIVQAYDPNAAWLPDELRDGGGTK